MGYGGPGPHPLPSFDGVCSMPGIVCFSGSDGSRTRGSQRTRSSFPSPGGGNDASTPVGLPSAHSSPSVLSRVRWGCCPQQRGTWVPSGSRGLDCVLQLP